MQEKEEKLLKLYESQQQRTIERVSRGSAGSDGATNTSTTVTIQGGRVRQMFDERRQKAGIDKSYPLEPLKSVRSTEISKSNNLDRNRNPVAKPATKQRTINYQTKTLKATTDKRIVKENMSVIQNGNAEYEEFRYQTKITNFEFEKDDNELSDLMNDHALEDSLDNEEMPIDMDECDEPVTIGKLVNVGGKLPSQKEFSSKEKLTNRVSVPIGKTISHPAKKDNKVATFKPLIFLLSVYLKSINISL